MQHSDMDWDLPLIEKYLFIGARGHRIHHSTADTHQNKNLGYLVLWDWMFGTLYLADEKKRDSIEKIEIGLEVNDDLKKIYNTASIKAQFWEIYAESLRGFFAHFIEKFRYLTLYRR